MIDLKPRVLEFIQKNGPILPIQVAKEIERDSFLASAILSELSHTKKIKVTTAKIGGSPLYYFPGQEYKLGILYEHLNQREKEAYDLLKKNLVLDHTRIKPVERVALAELRDFSIPINVKQGEEIKRFWKWHLISDEQAKIKIGELLGVNEKNKEEQKRLVEKPIEKIKEIKDQIKKKIFKREDEFLNLINDYCRKEEIEILFKEVVKKNREINLKINLSTKLGDLTFFVKARNKKKITNADLSLAYNEAQQLGLPVLFLTTGEPNKKMDEFIENKLRNQLLFKRIK